LLRFLFGWVSWPDGLRDPRPERRDQQAHEGEGTLGEADRQPRRGQLSEEHGHARRRWKGGSRHARVQVRLPSCSQSPHLLMWLMALSCWALSGILDGLESCQASRRCSQRAVCLFPPSSSSLPSPQPSKADPMFRLQPWTRTRTRSERSCTRDSGTKDRPTTETWTRRTELSWQTMPIWRDKVRFLLRLLH
jgi:hypothetical protein